MKMRRNLYDEGNIFKKRHKWIKWTNLKYVFGERHNKKDYS